MQFLRNGIVRLGGNHVATAALAEAKSVIGAGDSLAIVPAHTERSAAMGAEIVGDDNLISDPVDDQQFVEQFRRYGAVDNLPRQRNWVPVPGKLRPIIGVKSAVERQSDCCGRRLNHGYRRHVYL